MTILITGNFQQHSEAREVLADLEGSGFSVDQTTTFLVHPAPQAAVAAAQAAAPAPQAAKTEPESASESQSASEAESEATSEAESTSASEPEPDQAGAGAVSGGVMGGAIGVVVGIASLPLIGPGAAPLLAPGAALAATAIGAYVGSLYGALEGLQDHNDDPKPALAPDARERRRLARKPGMLVAVLANESAEQDIAIRILRHHGATDIERLEGVISAGAWTDFNPRLRLSLLADALSPALPLH